MPEGIYYINALYGVRFGICCEKYSLHLEICEKYSLDFEIHGEHVPISLTLSVEVLVKKKDLESTFQNVCRRNFEIRVEHVPIPLSLSVKVLVEESRLCHRQAALIHELESRVPQSPYLSEILKSQCPGTFTIESHYDADF